MADYQVTPLFRRLDLIASTAALMETVWPTHYGPDGPGNASADLKARANDRGLPFAVIAHMGNTVVGTGTLSGPSYGSREGETPWIMGLCVSPDHRRKGAATCIVTALEGHARSSGFSKVFATTIGARGLLERIGFQNLRLLEDDTGSWRVMTKLLQ